jgi:hypothetical protein
LNRGKLVIVGIVAVALGAALFSMWYHHQHARRAREFWGTSMAVLIARAPQVDALQLAAAEVADNQVPADDPVPADDSEPHTVLPIAFGGRAWSVVAAKESLQAAGMSNIRRALVIDTTFDWAEPQGASHPKWQYALEFTDDEHWATVLFDFDTRQVALAGSQKTALLDPAANTDMQEFFNEQFAKSEQPAAK